jgi:hypothetical protein
MIQTPRPSASPIGQWGSALPRKTLIGFLAALVAVLAMTTVSYQALQARSESAKLMAQSLEIVRKIESTFSTLKDAELGQRGFLLTGSDRFLEPYTAALSTLPRQLAEVRRLAAGNMVNCSALMPQTVSLPTSWPASRRRSRSYAPANLLPHWSWFVRARVRSRWTACARWLKKY